MDKKTIKKLGQLGCSVINDNKIKCRGQTIDIHYLPKKDIKPFYGHSYPDNRIQIMQELPPDVKRHVLIHEVVHQLGEHTEMGANKSAFWIDPKGWFKTAGSTINDPDRRAYYMNKIFGR